MTLTGAASGWRGKIERWFTVPTENGPGRLGIFRILYSLFYLWHLSDRFGHTMAGLPLKNPYRVVMLRILPDFVDASPALFLAQEFLLVLGLVFLLFGYRTPIATGVVLIVGCIYEAYRVSVGLEHSTVFLCFFIPFFMLVCGGWGDSYSVDALIRRRKNQEVRSPSNSHWGYAVGARANLVLLSALFLGAALFKVTPGSTWIAVPDLFGNIVLARNVRAILYDLPPNPLAVLIAQTPALEISLRYLVVLVEGTFFLALINGKWRNYMVSQMLVFHAVNALWLMVSFTPILVVYGLFIDWHVIRLRFFPRRLGVFDAAPPIVLVAATTGVALIVAILWNEWYPLRSVFNLGGRLDFQTIFIPVLPLAAVWWFFATRDLAAGAADYLRRRRSGRAPVTAPSSAE